MKETSKREIAAVERACNEIRSTGQLSEKTRMKLLKLFSKRFENAMNLVDKNRVKKYMFKPSDRVIWTVLGRKGEYQVIPETNFCNCDDYYFRVIDREKTLCYHIIAQRFAEALGRYTVKKLPDRAYGSVTEKWKVVEEETQTSE